MTSVAGTAVPGADREYLVFRVGGVRCGIDVARVQEINRNMDVTRVFSAPPDVVGVINLRGSIVTLLDLAQRLGVPDDDERGHPKNVIVSSQGEVVGLVVDDVEDIVSAGPGEVLPPPAHLPDGIRRCATGVLPMRDLLVILLDADQAAR